MKARTVEKLRLWFDKNEHAEQIALAVHTNLCFAQDGEPEIFKLKFRQKLLFDVLRKYEADLNMEHASSRDWACCELKKIQSRLEVNELITSLGNIDSGLIKTIKI
jgi:hypothetical protein